VRTERERVAGSRNGDSACETLVSGRSQDHLRKMKAGTGKQEGTFLSGFA